MRRETVKHMGETGKVYGTEPSDDPRRKILVGVEFSEQERNLGNWLVEDV